MITLNDCKHADQPKSFMMMWKVAILFLDRNFLEYYDVSNVKRAHLQGEETWYDVQLHQGQKYFPKKWSILSEHKTSCAQLVNKMSRPWCNMIGNGVTKSKVIINVFSRIYLGLKWPYSIDSLEESLVQTICFHTIAV